MNNYQNKLIFVALVVFGLTIFTACKKDKVIDDDNKQNTDENSWVLCYHPCYQWYVQGGGALTIPWEQISHLTLGYLLPFENDQGQWDIKVPDSFYPGQNGWMQTAGEYIAEGHVAEDKIICMLGGAGSNVGANLDFWDMATEVGNVETFAANIKSLLQPVGFDGVDLDWEEGLDYDGFLRLVKELRRIWPEAIITIPTGPSGGDAVGLAPCNEYVDAFMPMSYMSVMQWGGWIIPVPPTPLYAYAGNPYSVELTLKKWTDAGVSASKVVMGVGGYGQVWGDSNADGQAPNSPYITTTTSIPEGERYANYGDNSVTQEWLTSTIANHPELIENWDDVGKCSYWSSPAPDNLVSTTIRNGQAVNVGLIFYETRRSLEHKFNYINNNSMKGMMFWSLRMMKEADNSYPILRTVNSFEAQK